MGNSTLADACVIVMGQSPAGEMCNSLGVGLPLLNGPTEYGSHHPTPVQFTTDARKYAKEGDVLFCVRGSTTGRMNWADREYAIGRGVAAIRHKSQRELQPLVRAVIEYNLPSLLIQATGSTFPNVSSGQLSNLPWPNFEESEQRAIAHILGTLDDKIELNRRMNETLEAMARALFKAWFVDFEPVRAKLEGRWQRSQSLPGLPAHLYDLFPDRLVDSELGEIPEGWKVKVLGDFVTIKRGGSPRPIQDFIRPDGFPWVKIADATSAPSRFLFQTKEFIKEEGLAKTVLLKKSSLILSNSATPGLPMFLELDACIHDGWLYFPKKNTFNDRYLYQLFLEIREDLVAQGNGSVFTNLKTDILRAQKIVNAPEELLEAFDCLIQPLFVKLLAVNTESRTLAQLRDALLPKLISGELRVGTAEATVR